jgi:integrase/recombinase XerD
MNNQRMITLKLSQALQGFYLTAHARKLSPHTIADYTHTLAKFQDFLGKDFSMQDITARHVESFLASQTTIKNKTLLNYHIGLSALWTWAIREHVAAEHVVRAVPAPRPERRAIVPYSEDEIRAMLSSLNRSKVYSRPGKRLTDHALPHAERNRAIILLLVDTGIRAEELCGIRIHQLDKRNQRIKVFGKGAKDRYVSFSPRTQQALWRYLMTRGEDVSEGDPLFVGSTGRPLDRSQLLKRLQKIGARAGVDGVTVHRFRHTFAIQYLRNHGDPYTLQKMLGHSQLQQIKAYLAIAQTDVEAGHRLASPVDNWHL